MISVAGVSHRVEAFAGREMDALVDVSLQIAPGEYLALMGANGSGKSTLVRHLNGLLLPTRGSVEVDGMDTRDRRHLFDVRARVGLVLQNPDHQMVAPVVEEEVAFGPENLGLSAREIGERVEASLAAVDMLTHRRHNPGNLSGGQKQRVAIASVLAMRPRYLILDEPTAMLDAAGREEVLAVLRRLNREAGVAVVLITHAMDEAAEAGRIVVMEKGRIALDGPRERVLADPDVTRRLGLASPAMVRVLQALADAGLPVSPPFPLDPAAAAQAVLEAAARRVRGMSVPAPAVPSTTGGEVQAELDGAWFRYMRGTPFETLALRDVSVQLRSHERVAVLGGTGSGKSTLMQHLNGLLRADSGRVEVCGVDLCDPRADLLRVRRSVGLVFQLPEHQLFEETVAADVGFGPRNLGFSPGDVAARVRSALEQVGLDPDEYESRSPLALSGGEMRRVAVAGVLAMEPRLLVMDEPLAGLDAAGQERLVAVLRAQHERGVSTVVVTHDQERVADVATRVVVMERAGVAYDGPVEGAFDLPGATRPPACLSLARALVAKGLPIDPAVARPEALAQEVVGALMNQNP